MEFGDKLLFVLMVIYIISFIGLMLFMSIDITTIKEIGEESVPCLDERYRPFENEMCIKKITCSWMGLMADKKCKDANSWNSEVKDEN